MNSADLAVPSPQEKATSTIKGLGVEALAMVNADTTPVQPVVPATPQATVPAVAQPGQPITQQQVVAPVVPAQPGQSTTQQPQTGLVTVDLGNGTVKQLTQAEVVEAYRSGLRQSDYTQKTQDIARQREEVQTLVQNLQQQQEAVRVAQYLLTNPQAMLQEAQRRLGSQQPPQVVDPSTPMTQGQAQQQLQALVQGFEHRLQGIEQGAQQYVENRLQVADFAEAINQTMGTVYTEHPVLKTVPEMEDVIRYRVAQLKPANLAEAQQAFKSISAEIASTIGNIYVQRQQEQNAQVAQLAQSSPVVPSGAPVQPTPKSYNLPNQKLDWKTLAQDALSLS